MCPQCYNGQRVLTSKNNKLQLHFNFNFSLLLLFFFLFTIEIYDNEFMLISEDASVDDNKRDGDDNTNAADGKENSAADM